MPPTVDAATTPWYPPSATESTIGHLPPDSKLEAGYTRYVCTLPSPPESPGIIHCRTCIRRSHNNESTNDVRTSGDDTISYLAVSYAWGDPTPFHEVVVDGQRRMLAKNLWQFLWQVKEQLSCWLWIDALSIDQSNAEERRHQVGIMSQIFQSAYGVIVWLGEAFKFSDTVMHALSKTSLDLRNFLSNDFQEFHYARIDSHFARNDGRYVSGSRHRTIWTTNLSSAVVNLCQRPYWKRLWVFQELRHARSIQLMCGQTTIPWTGLRNIWSLMAELGMLNKTTAETLRQSLATRMVTLRAKPMNSSLWNLLRETKDLMCADDRDRVYALLSVATEGHEDIEADYHSYVSSQDLAHHVLRNKYALRPPSSLNDMIRDCEFLTDVFKMSERSMFAQDFSKLTSLGKFHQPYFDLDPQRHALWSEWAHSHGHSAVTKLLQSRK